MIEDFDSNEEYEERNNNPSDKFYLSKFDLDEDQSRERIVSMATSRKYIFFLTQSHNIFCVESESLQPTNETYTLPEPKGKGHFKENFDKIWTDREGNHCIIRHNNAIYYFNTYIKEPIELENFRGKEICAIALDDRNTEVKTTKNFLAVDYDNKIYECCIEYITDEKTEQGIIQDKIEELISIFISDLGLEDEDPFSRFEAKPINDRIYGIKFFHATNSNIDQGVDNCYIIAVTKNRLYQFIGLGLKNFKQIFKRYEKNPSLINESCFHFPLNRRNFLVQFDILYKNELRNLGDNKQDKIDVLNQFGWRTSSGYCYGEFEYDKSEDSSGLPFKVKNFTVIPFEKINAKGIKETNLTPRTVIHTCYHIFILYEDCLTIVSKISSNIIFTKYFDKKYDLMIYNEFSEDNGIILLSSIKGLEQISLKKENDDLWIDYLDIDDYEKALNYCDDENKKKIINKLNAEEKLAKDEKEAGKLYIDTDEKFEMICLNMIREGHTECLKSFLNNKLNRIKERSYLTNEDNFQLSIIINMILEIFIQDNNTDKFEFKGFIRENKKYINQYLMFQLLKNYGKVDEYEESYTILEDYKSIIFYRINQGQIVYALSFLSDTAAITEKKETLNMLGNIFLDNCRLFFQKDVKNAFLFLHEVIIKNKVEIDDIMEKVILALMSRRDKDMYKAKNRYYLFDKEKKTFDEEVKCILENLKLFLRHYGFYESLKNQIKQELTSINNLYLFYLSINPTNRQSVIEFLKDKIKKDSKNAKKIQYEYAKSLLKENNKKGYALILALTGKYSEGISYVLKKESNETKENSESNQEIAEFIAKNVKDEKLKKSLWIQIIRNISENIDKMNNENKNEEEFTQAMKIMEKSKVLKMEDVLRYITDSTKLVEITTKFVECIEKKEKNINELKHDIKNYNKTFENISTDLYHSKKKSIELKYNEFKCSICQDLIRNKRVFLFPCGHMFDMDCIRLKLLDYENTGIEYLHEDNILIDKLFFELGFIPKKFFRDKEEDKDEKEDKGEEVEEIEEDKYYIQTLGQEAMKRVKKIGGFFSKIKKDIYQGFWKKEEIINKNDEENEKKYNELKKILNKHCVLCGDFLIDSVQNSLEIKLKFDDNEAEEPDFDI